MLPLSWLFSTPVLEPVAGNAQIICCHHQLDLHRSDFAGSGEPLKRGHSGPYYP